MDADPVCAAKHHAAVFAEDGQVNPDGTLPNAVTGSGGAYALNGLPP